MNASTLVPPRLRPIYSATDELTFEALRLTEEARRGGSDLVAISPPVHPWGWALWLLPRDPIAPMRALRMHREPDGTFALGSSRLGVPVGRCPFLGIGKDAALACHAHGGR
jgi:hypothetical protein